MIARSQLAAIPDAGITLGAIVSGAFRRLSSGRSEITVIGDGGWSASNLPRGADVARILADPTGWDEVAGGPWLRPD